jgi:cyclic beta-1,2-glucan synthetase
MYRAWLEDVLGFTLRGERLRVTPTLPAAWEGCVIRYRHRGPQHETRYVIAIENPDRVGHGVAWVEVDGQRLGEPDILLTDDGAEHRVVVRLGGDAGLRPGSGAEAGGDAGLALTPWPPRPA